MKYTYGGLRDWSYHIDIDIYICVTCHLMEHTEESKQTDEDEHLKAGSDLEVGQSLQFGEPFCRPSCPGCLMFISEPYIKCHQCLPEVIICLRCFAKGKEFENHLNSHDYEVRSNAFPIFADNWSAAEELKLLDTIMDVGFGNWTEVSKQIQTKNAAECEEHYMKFYVDDPRQPLPVLPENHVFGWYRPMTFRAGDDPPRPQANSEASSDLAGYMACRGDFSVEYDSFAESDIKDIVFEKDDDELAQELKIAALDIFWSRLKQRQFRKRIIKDYGLINIYKNQPLTYGKQERLIRDALRVFTRLQNPEEHEQFTQAVLLQNYLQKQVKCLQEYRRAGLKSKKDAVIYENLKRRRKEAKLKRTFLEDVSCHFDDPLSCQVWLQRQLQFNMKSIPGNIILPPLSRKPAAPLDLSGTPGVEQLEDDEKELCSTLRLLPRSYLAHKNNMIVESQKSGSLRLQQARLLIKIDVNKTRKLYDFFAERGWIKKDFRD